MVRDRFFPIESELIEKHLHKKTENIRTRRNIRRSIEKYFEFIGTKDIETYFKKPEDEIEDDVDRFADSIKNEPPKSQLLYLGNIERFFKRNNILKGHQVWEDIRDRKHLKGLVSRQTVKKELKKHDIKIILSHGNKKSVPLFLLCATSGIRIGEALSIRVEDVDIDNRMVMLLPEITKCKYQRFTFFTEECAERLGEWMKERGKAVIHSYKRSIHVRNQWRNLYNITWEVKRKKCKGISHQEWKFFKDEKEINEDDLISYDNRVFPFSYSNARLMWENLVESAGSPYNEKDTNPRLKRPEYKYDIHRFRGFFKTMLDFTDMNKSYLHFISGHKSLLDREYIEYINHPDMIKKEYDKYSKMLSIYSDLDIIDEKIAPELQVARSELGKLSLEFQKYKDETQVIDLYNYAMMPLLFELIDPERLKVYMKGVMERKNINEGKAVAYMLDQMQAWIEAKKSGSKNKDIVEEFERFKKEFKDKYE